MASAEQKLLTNIFDQFVRDEYPQMSEDDVFERFAVTQLRKPKELATTEIEAGIVDGSFDGGIDAFYVFLNGVALTPDHPFLESGSEAHKGLARNPKLEILLVQSKNQSSWKEAAWEKLLSSLRQLLDIAATDLELEHDYNPAVVEATGIARTAMNVLAPKFPKVSVRIAYASRASEDQLSALMFKKADQVEELLRELLTANAEIKVEHAGAESLYQLASEPLGTPATLTFRELVRESSSYLGVVSVEEYLTFIRESDGVTLREDLFDSNVRDFEGDNQVNSAISRTLAEKAGVEFWWLNNGVTVLGDEVSGQQKALTISRPLIVNGLQTSHVLHRADIEEKLHTTRRDNGIVVRVIESIDERVRDSVIEGTNRQTPVPSAALKATDQQQVKLEEYLKLHGFFYERRKNRYKNLGKPADRRISMSLLAQVMIVALRGEPDQARARPSSILTRKNGWETVFPSSLDLDVYVQALHVYSAVQNFLKSDEAKGIHNELTNTRFYVLAGYLLLRSGSKQFDSVRFAKSHSNFRGEVKSQDLALVLGTTADAATSFQRQHPEMSRDSIFKSAEFRDYFLEAIGEIGQERK